MIQHKAFWLFPDDYVVSKKSLCSRLLNKMGQDFLDIQYALYIKISMHGSSLGSVADPDTR